MGLTLLEAAKQASDPAQVAVIRELAMGELSGSVPFRAVTGGGLDYMVESDLPAVGFRGINEAYDPSVGVMNPQYERLKILGGDIDVDLFLLRTQGEAIRAQQIEMKVRSMRFTFEDYFINGDSAVDPRAFDGLKTRLVVGSSQAIANTGASGALSFNMLETLYDAVEAPGAEKVLIMNKAVKRRLSAFFRSSGLPIEQSRDEFGRPFLSFNGMRTILTDTNAFGAQIQPFTETTGSASSTSIYCVAMGDLYTTGIQGAGGIQIRSMGEVDDAPVDRTRIEWDCGQAVLNGRSAARLYGVTNLAVVA